MKIRRLLLLVIIFSLLFGCAAKRPMSWQDESTSLRNYSNYIVENATNETGEQFELDITSLLTDNIISKLRKEGFTVEETPEPGQSLILRSKIVSYEPGNAFKRWVLAGTGRTICTVQVSILEPTTNKKLAEFISSKVISAGGVFSIGADRKILEFVAEAIAQEVRELTQG